MSMWQVGWVESAPPQTALHIGQNYVVHMDVLLTGHMHTAPHGLGGSHTCTKDACMHVIIAEQAMPTLISVSSEPEYSVSFHNASAFTHFSCLCRHWIGNVFSKFHTCNTSM